MAENAICLCRPGTIPLYKAVAPSFLTIETRVPNWDIYSYEGLNHEEEDGDNDDNMLVGANKDDDYDGDDDDDDDDSLLLEAAMLLHPWRSAPLGLEVAPLLSMMNWWLIIIWLWIITLMIVIWPLASMIMIALIMTDNMSLIFDPNDNDNDNDNDIYSSRWQHDDMIIWWSPLLYPRERWSYQQCRQQHQQLPVALPALVSGAGPPKKTFERILLHLFTMWRGSPS